MKKKNKKVFLTKEQEEKIIGILKDMFKPVPTVLKQPPFRCPICNGIGLVDEGFYTQNMDGIWTTSRCGKEPCKSCNGTGIVWQVEATQQI